MNATVVISSVLLLGALHAVSSISPLIAQAGVSKNPQSPASTAKSNSNGAAAAGQGKDGGEKIDPKLNACLSSIPADSSGGQRLLAEQSCRKEHEVRSARHAAPEF
jgi:hypothetical protein